MKRLIALSTLLALTGCGTSGSLLAGAAHSGVGVLARGASSGVAPADARYVTQAVMGHYVREFRLIDGDRDGRVTRADIRQARERGVFVPDVFYAHADRNEDQVVTLAELRAEATRTGELILGQGVERHARLDLNGDGLVTPEEGEKVHQGSKTGVVIGDMLRDMDRSGDGKVSLSEYLKAEVAHYLPKGAAR